VLAAALLATIVPNDLPRPWYGPATATFRIQFVGNQYDPAENDVRVRFLGPKGAPIERLAYFDAEEGAWKATLVTEQTGMYKATLVRNGQVSAEENEEGVLDLTKATSRGYLRRDPAAVNRFRWDNREPYYPLGFNLGWQNGDLLPLTEQIAKMGKNGVNWTRVWAASWDGKNPWWPQNDAEALPGELWSPALKKWQDVVAACDANGVAFQMVLHNHGSFSSKVNPNWPDHPWNAAKGGFLKDAADFFTDAEAKRRTKMWLRYAVARYAHSSNLMAWELFNEVEWVDARYADRWPDIEKWHAEMAEYLRSIDPYGHLVTTSSAMDRPDLWKAMDYTQPHAYPSSILAAVVGAERPADKPQFFGEIGASNMETADVRRVVRDGLLGGMLTNQAGAAQFWYWDYVEKKDLYSEFANAAKIAQISDLARRPLAKPLDLRLDTEGTADLILVPGGGWEKASKTSFAVPEEASLSAMRGLPNYFQGQQGENSALFPEPIVLTFNATKPGKATFRVNQVSKNGTTVRMTINGKVVATKEFPGAEKETDVTATLTGDFKPGRNEVRVENVGKDWVRWDSLTVTSLAPQASALALGESDWMMVRLTAAPGADGTIKATLGRLPLGNGNYELTTFDLDKGTPEKSQIKIDSARLPVTLTAKDAVLIFRKQ